MKKTLAGILIFLVVSVSAQPFGQKPEWLNSAVIYQVYPSSFADSDGNGIGDIPGVISKLDYIASLGVDVIWFNPLFSSGWIDGGYDILDYYKVDPRFGTNSDLVRLINEAHARNIKVFLDLVPGHTSMDHPWFRQSMEGKDMQYSDYFIWADDISDKAKKDLEKMMKEKNPMQSTKGKWMSSSAPRARYYYKNFYACQPALNFGYANPNPKHPWEQSVDAPGPKAVKRELVNIISFWYDKGVDGFRVDMAGSLVKNDKGSVETKKLWQGIRRWMDEQYPEHVLMAEWNKPEVALPAGFNIDMSLNGTRSKVRRMYFDRKHQAEGGCYFSLNGCKPSVRDLYGKDYSEKEIKESNPEEILDEYYAFMTKSLEIAAQNGFFATITGNHDHLRFNTGPRNTPEQLKVSMAWVMTMPLPILYYGDEIGLKSLVDLPNREGANHDSKERAGGRTPMQWNGSKNAGFSTCDEKDLYLPVCPEWTPCYSFPDYLSWKQDGCKKPTAKGAITVESQEGDPESLLSWTKSLISLRHACAPLWADAKWSPIRIQGEAYPMMYLRTAKDGRKVIVILNPTGEKKNITIPSQTESRKGELKARLSAGKVSYRFTPKGDAVSMGPTSVFIGEF